MGIYLNPGNESMLSAVNSEIYVDKTGLLPILNGLLYTEKRYLAVSRARRFGKSQACGMIDAYYSRGCDSKELFAPFEIAKDPGFEKHLNKYNVLHFDVSTWFNAAKSPEEVVPLIDKKLLDEMILEFPYLAERNPIDTPDAMGMAYEREKVPFIVVVDEYDCIVRDSAENEDVILDFLKYLRGFFKTEESKKFLALGYITGILPVKKMKGESALNNFSEYTMTDPGSLVSCFGFTQKEVEALCFRYGRKIDGIRDWYDGYYMYSPCFGLEEEIGEKNSDGSIRIFDESPQRLFHIYNPNSVFEAFTRNKVISYWKNTGAFSSLLDFITLNYSGLKEDIVAMLAGERRKVNVNTFQNDLTHFKSKDDVFTCLIHMGYLGYDSYNKETFIPNREVGEVFEAAIKTSDWNDISESLKKSDELLKATIDGDSTKVANAIATSHQNYASIINFSDENSLAVAIMISYYTARSTYRVVREIPSGKGFADIAFIPKKEGDVPAMIVELKWNRSAKAAISQIRKKNYTGVLSDYKGEILLVGINYTKKSKKYSCRIERLEF